MTYRTDSDFPIPYGKIVPKEDLTDDEIRVKIRDFGRKNAEKYMVRLKFCLKIGMSKH